MKARDWATELCQSSEAENDKRGGALALREIGASYQSQANYDAALQFSEMSYRCSSTKESSTKPSAVFKWAVRYSRLAIMPARDLNSKARWNRF